MGELYNHVTEKWEMSENWNVRDIEMSSDPDQNRWDFHVWLFAWKQDSIFHAGPAKTMHWITTNNPRTISGAGTRQDDGDAVCGVTSMYDAEKGLILTVGGAPQYHFWVDPARQVTDPNRKPATNNAFIIQLGDPGMNALVTKTDQMRLKRIFANAVTLPNGETLVVGGQVRGEPFWEYDWHREPEIFSPNAPNGQKWRNGAPHSTPRVYHSIALLLPDATVLVGGSGLSRQETNHFDAQIYYPPYLLQGGRLAPRPSIKSVSPGTIRVGEILTFTTTIAIDTGISASLVRYSAVTHSLNNDQRRIALEPQRSNEPDFSYTVRIPADRGVALPGYWMLFVMANGVPSESQRVQILA
jgi:galactose oxidase